MENKLRIGIFLLLFCGFWGWVDSAQASTWYVSASGSGTSCAVDSPCALLYAIDTKCVAGDTVILNSGTYVDNIDLDTAGKHQNLTITTTSEVISALGTFTYGIPSGTDNRPYFSSNRLIVRTGITGVNISYMRFRGGSAPANWGVGLGNSGVVTFDAPQSSISYSEIWNGGQGIGISTVKQITINNNYIHHGGAGTFPVCGGNDHHGIAVYNWQGHAAATNWDEGIVVENNTISYFEGDGMQELGEYASDTQGLRTVTQYLIQRNNHVYNNCEQGFDYKGTRYVKIYGNDIHDNNYGGTSTNDSDGAVNYQHLYWWIYNNKFHDHTNFGLMSQEGDDGYWYVWNNLFYDNCQNPAYNWHAFADVPPNSRVENNVFYNNNRSAGNGAGGISSTRSSSVGIKNNIFFNNGTGSYGNIYGGSLGTIDNNYVYPTSPGMTGTNAISDNDPNFVSLSLPYDFRLQSNSSLKDAGLALVGDADLTIGTDFAGVARPQGAAWDIGAYEYVPEGDTVPPAAPSGLAVQ